ASGGALVRSAALLGAAGGLVHLAAALRRRGEDGPKSMPTAVVAYIAGLHGMSILYSIPMNLHYSAEYAYVLMVFAMHLSGFAANLLSPLAWMLDDSYLPSLPFLWVISVVDTLIAVLRGPLLIWSIVMLKWSQYLEGAWLLLLFGLLGAAMTLPVMILLLLGSLARFRHLLGRAQIKED
ncbi:unnamed protein product, partial [Effrenium voratum]